MRLVPPSARSRRAPAFDGCLSSIGAVLLVVGLVVKAIVKW